MRDMVMLPCLFLDPACAGVPAEMEGAQEAGVAPFAAGAATDGILKDQ